MVSRRSKERKRPFCDFSSYTDMFSPVKKEQRSFANEENHKGSNEQHSTATTSWE